MDAQPWRLKKKYTPVPLPPHCFLRGHQKNFRPLHSNAGADTPSEGLPLLCSNGHKSSSPTQYAAASVHSSTATVTNPNGTHSTGELNQSSNPSAANQSPPNGQPNNVSASRVGSGSQSERERLHSARDQQTVVPLLGTTQPLLSRLGASTGSSNGVLDIYFSYPDRCDLINELYLMYSYVYVHMWNAQKNYD